MYGMDRALMQVEMKAPTCNDLTKITSVIVCQLLSKIVKQ